MSSVAASAAFPGAAAMGLPRYEQLREEQELAALEAGGATVVHLAPPRAYPPPPRDHVAWSIFTTLYLNFFCLGFLALVFSVKARDRKLVGDHNAASSYGSTARSLNITALMLSLLVFLLAILYCAKVIVL